MCLLGELIRIHEYLLYSTVAVIMVAIITTCTREAFKWKEMLRLE